jgi:hypothetical protein
VEMLQLHALRFFLHNLPCRTQLKWLGNLSCLQDDNLAWTMQKTQPICCCRGMFATLLHSNSHSANHVENTLFPIVTLLLHVYSLSWECDYLAVAQKRSLFTQSLLSSGSLHHIAPSLRLFVPNSLQAYRHFFFSEGCAWSHNPPHGSVFRGVCSPTGPTTPSLSPLIPSGSFIGWQSVQV